VKKSLKNPIYIYYPQDFLRAIFEISINIAKI
jgi:hypothetical protein